MLAEVAVFFDIQRVVHQHAVPGEDTCHYAAENPRAKVVPRQGVHSMVTRLEIGDADYRHRTEEEERQHIVHRRLRQRIYAETVEIQRQHSHYCH